MIIDNKIVMTLAIILPILSCSEVNKPNQHNESDLQTGMSDKLSKKSLDSIQRNRNSISGEQTFSVFLHLMAGWSADGVEPAEAEYWLDLSIQKKYWPAVQHRVARNLALRTELSCQNALSDLQKFGSHDDYKKLENSIYLQDVEYCSRFSK